MKAYNLRLLISSVLFLFLFNPSLAIEDIRYYDIELVVFENLEEIAGNTEIWPKGRQLVVPENATVLGQKFTGELPPEFDTKHLFKLLAVEDYQLTEEVDTLKESENYRVLLHTGWRQPGLAKDKAIPIHFTHAISETPEETEPQVEPPVEPGQAETPVMAQQAAAEETAQPSFPNSKLAHLEGVIKIVLSRYLHLDVEMLYQKEGQDENIDMFDTSFLEERSDKEPVYYLQQNRRMRSKETHYIDHPKFSMLVRITPFKVELPAEPAPATPAAPKG